MTQDNTDDERRIIPDGGVGGGGDISDIGTGGGGAGGFGGGGGGGTPGSRHTLSSNRDAVVETGACGRITVTVEPQNFGAGAGGSGVNVAAWNNVGVRVDWTGMGSIGGGEDYTAIVTESDADIVATSVQDLQDAARTAESGDVVFVPGTIPAEGGDDGEDDSDGTEEEEEETPADDPDGTEEEPTRADGGVTTQVTTQSNHDIGEEPTEESEVRLDAGSSTITFPQDEVTVASNRGEGGSTGAVIERSRPGSGDSSPLFRMTGEAARVSGFSLQGPREDVFNPSGSGPASTAIRLDGNGCEVDNCDISGFTNAGVAIIDVVTAAVHHNNIHDNGMVGGGQAIHLDQPEPSQLQEGSCSPGENAAAGGGVSGGSGSAQSLTQPMSPPSTVGPTVLGDGGSNSEEAGETTTRAILTFNDFDANQHAVSATGDGASFTFKRSRVGPTMYSHGVRIREPGGFQATISQVTFEADANQNSSCVRVNGVPERQVEIIRAWMQMGSRELAVRQVEDGRITADAGRGGFENISIEKSTLGGGTPSSSSVGAQRYL